MKKRSQNAPFDVVNDAPAVVRKTLLIWHKTEVLVAIIAFSMIALILIYDVLAREILPPIMAILGYENAMFFLYGSQKYAVILMIIGAFTSIGIATWSGAQLVPKIGSQMFLKSWDKTFNRIADIVTFLVLLGVTVVACVFVLQSYSTGVMTSGGVGIAVWQVQIAIPLGFGSAAMRYLAFAIWPDLRPTDLGLIK